MTEEVTKIINVLCEKLGVASSYLIPELAKKKKHSAGYSRNYFVRVCSGGGNSIYTLDYKEEYGRGWCCRF